MEFSAYIFEGFMDKAVKGFKDKAQML